MNLVRNAIEKYVPKTLFRGKQENYEYQHVIKQLTELEFINALYFDEETQRLIEIGRATEKAFDYKPEQEGAYNIFALGELHEESEFAFYSVETLLEWAKGVG